MKIEIKCKFSATDGNFFVENFAEYVRANNYPCFNADEVILTSPDGQEFSYIVSQDDSNADLFEDTWGCSSIAEFYGECVGVKYAIMNRDFSMLIDGHYYYLTA